VTWRIRAHFDGNVLVPDERVDLPVNQPLEAEVTGLPGNEPRASSAVIEERMRRLAQGAGLFAARPDGHLWTC